MEVLMGLSRKRQRELDRLKRQAEDLMREQRAVLEQASRVVRAAGHQASSIAREDVAPRVKDAYEDRVRPAVRRGRDRFIDDVVPAVTSALGSAIAVIESVKGPAQHAIDDASRSARKAGARVGIIEEPRSGGPGKYIVLGVAFVALAGVAYAAWQTLRADESLWIDDEGDEDLPTAS
jgi:hypothetical protein